MSEITIEFTPQTKAKLARMQTLPGRILVGIKRGLDEQNAHTVSYIQRTSLSFPKQGPTVLNGLRVITNRLRNSVRATKAVIVGQNVSASIGSNVRYAKVHEFGGTFQMPARKGIVRLSTNRSGVLKRQKDGRLAIFARKRSKLAKEVAFEGKPYEVTYPERMPVRRGIMDLKGDYADTIAQHLQEAFT